MTNSPFHIRDLAVEMLKVSALSPYQRNARTHSQRQIRQIAESIREFGWTLPILIDAGGLILVGHGRAEAAKLLGIEHVPVIRVEHLSEAQKRAYIIADNRLAEKAGWDTDLLALEFQDLSGMDLSFDLEITGFDTGRIDMFLQHEADEDDAPVDLPEAHASAVSRVGDLWAVGPHKILCGDTDWSRR